MRWRTAIAHSTLRLQPSDATDGDKDVDGRGLRLEQTWPESQKLTVGASDCGSMRR